MRLDVYLKLSRLVPRRSLAQDLCEKGLIEVNGSNAKSSKEVNVGDQVTIKKRTKITVARITSVPETKQTSKAAAADLYELISETTVDSA